MSTPYRTLVRRGLAALLVLASLAVGCAGGDPNVAATVNGAEISVDQINERVDEALRNPQVPQIEQDPETMRSLQTQVLDRMVEMVLLEQAAKQIGITVTDQEVQERLDEVIAEVGGRQAYEQLLEQRGLSEEGVLAEVRSAVLDERAKQKLGDRVQVDAAEVQRVYAAATGARHILLRTREEAQTVKNRIAAGEDFGAVAKERSADEGTKEQGGDLGFVKQGDTVPEFEQALFAAAQDEVVGPVQTQFGFHVIQRLPGPPFEQVQAQLQDELLGQRREEVFLDFLSEQRTKATVEVNPRFGVWDPSSGVRPSAPLGTLESEPRGGPSQQQAPGE